MSGTKIPIEYTAGGGAQFPTSSSVASVPGTAVLPPTAAPIYTATATASTAHDVYGSVPAAGAATTVTLNAQVAFKTAVYSLVVYDTTTFTAATVTAQSANAFTFSSVAGHVYTYDARGV